MHLAVTPPPRVITIWPHIHTSRNRPRRKREREEETEEEEDKYLEGIKRAEPQRARPPRSRI